MKQQLRIKLIRLIKEYLHKFANDGEITRIANLCGIDIKRVKERI